MADKVNKQEMQTEEKKDKSGLLTTVVVIILCLFFVGGFFLGLNKVLAMEGNFPPDTVYESVTPDSQNNVQLVDHIDSIIEKALSEKPLANGGTSYSISSSSIKATTGEKTENTLKYIKDGFTQQLDSNHQAFEAGYFEGFDSFVKVPSLTANEVESFDYTYYECGSCHMKSDTAFERCPECNVPDECRNYAAIHNVSVILKNDKNTEKELFGDITNEQILAMAGNGLDNVLDVTSISVDVTGLEMSFKADRETDKLTHIEYRKLMTVKASVTFKGEYAALGNDEIIFDITRKDSFDFTWPALSLSDNTMTVEPKGSENLLATLICDEPLNYTVTWASSDESIVTVDQEGYFKAGKQTGTAVITASYEFGGQTFSDECEINVRYSVESLKMSKKKLELNQGETATLKVSFSPKKATVQTLKWYTEDASIATVDENGVVTAVGSGVVTIYALSDDGYFKSTSEVTVK